VWRVEECVCVSEVKGQSRQERQTSGKRMEGEQDEGGEQVWEEKVLCLSSFGAFLFVSCRWFLCLCRHFDPFCVILYSIVSVFVFVSGFWGL